jgi:hypothetical protein
MQCVSQGKIILDETEETGDSCWWDGYYLDVLGWCSPNATEDG